MPKTLTWTIGTAGIAGAVLAILSVSSRPEPRNPAPQAPNQDEQVEPLGDESSANAFIEKAHREALDQQLRAIESELPQIAPWALIEAGHPIDAPYPAWPVASYADTQRWSKKLAALHELDPKRLTRQGQVMLHSAQFLLNRTIHQKHEDPLAFLKKAKELSQQLTRCWIRDNDCTRQLPGWVDLNATLKRLGYPKNLSKAQAKNAKALVLDLTAQVHRWSKAKSQLPTAWHPVIEALTTTLASLKGRRPSRALAQATDQASFTKEVFDRWCLWELGQRTTLKAAQQGIIQTRQRLHTIQESLPKNLRPAKARRPNLEQCQTAQQQLHERFGQNGLWVERKVSCPRLLALVDLPSHDALMHHLIHNGWLEPSRYEHRARQRPIISALASTWGPSVHAQLRELMFLAQAPELGWAQERSWRVLRQMQSDLCEAQKLLGQLDPSLAPPPQTCATSPIPDRYRAFKGIRTGAMPKTRAVMAGLDRFYWGPTQLALYWATPKGVELGHFGRTGLSSQAPREKVKVEVQALHQP